MSRRLPGAIAVLLAACTVTPHTATIPPVSTPSATDSPTGTATPTSTPLGCVQRTFNDLTIDERVGQLFMLGLGTNTLDASTRDAIEKYGFASVWFTQNSTVGVVQIAQIARSIQSLARNGVHFFIAANQEGGSIQAMKGPGFSTIPAADVQGTMAASVLQADATHWGTELKRAGINFNFAPVFDVVPPGTDAQNAPIGGLHREYGHDVATVAVHALAFARGMTAAGVVTSAKHFPGLGRVQGNTDYTGNVVDDTTTTTDLSSFEQAVGGGVPFVMVALATYSKIDPNHLAVFSPIVINELLRGRLGFKGVVISDDLGATAAVKSIPPGSRAIDFLRAGGDMIISKTLASAIAMHGAIVQRIHSNARFAAIVDAAVLKILQAKRAAGLLACG